MIRLAPRVLVVVALSWALSWAAVCHAQPGLATTSSPPATDANYISVGAAVGADKAIDWLYTSLAVEGGFRLNSTWWIHGELSVANRTGWGTLNRMTVVTPTQADSFVARVGPEARTCTSGGSLCGVAGVDLGYRSIDQRVAMRGLVLVHRLGLDVGTANLRFRPMVEVALGPTDSSEGPPIPDIGIGITTAVAYQW